MRRILYSGLVLFLLLVACQVQVTEPAPAPALDSPPPTQKILPYPTPTLFSLRPTPLPTETPAATVPVELYLPADEVDYSVRLHPDGALHVGDLVSLEVIALAEGDPEDFDVLVHLPDGGTLGPVKSAPHGIARRMQATLLWEWDTSGLGAGEYSLGISIEGQGPSWTETVLLLPEEELPFPEPGARWVSVESECCVIHYITGTAAERDLAELQAQIYEHFDQLDQFLEPQMDEPISFTFLPRVLGHGGFAGQDISLSYLDRNYAGGTLEQVLHHELVHKMDSALEGELRPTILVEGLAVYLSGGHFKPEPLMPRAAALLSPVEGCQPAADFTDPSLLHGGAQVCSLGWYLPLDSIVDDFYFQQHETGYLEAGALVEYMVDTWGWEAFSDFYRDIRPIEGDPDDESNERQSQSSAMQAALKSHFGLTLKQLDDQFQEALRAERLSPQQVEDVRLMVGFYDTVRRYQKILDPSAYFLTAWLTDGGTMREREIVADYLRRPSSDANIALELLLVEADIALRVGDFLRTEYLLGAINSVLDQFDASAGRPFAVHPLAADYYAITRLLLAEGYQPQRLVIENHKARSWVTRNGAELSMIYLQRADSGWVILMGAQ